MKVYIETYGCQMNEYDSSMIMSMLRSSGHSFVDDPSKADAIIVNTCSVRDRAEKRVLGRLSHLRGLAGRDVILGVVGCVAQRMGAALAREVEGLSFVVGTDQYALLPDVLESVGGGVERFETAVDSGQSYVDRPEQEDASLLEFVSVARGCDNYCSYCIVPYVRGRERSRPSEAAVGEVRRLVGLGTRDVTLLGQNVNSYRDGSTDFAGLLALMNEVDGLERIRFATSHPKDLSETLVAAMAGLSKVCEHLHLPVQSGSNRILEAMNRSYTRERYLDLVRLVRSNVPGVALTTDIIVGFPGETESDFEETLSLMREVRFDSAFMFRYSVREGTKAASLPDDVPENVKIERLQEIIDIQKSVTTELNEALAGSTLEVLLEGPNDRDPAMLFGRTRTGKAVVARGPAELAGSLARVGIERASAWTLHGVVTGDG